MPRNFKKKIPNKVSTPSTKTENKAPVSTTKMKVPRDKAKKTKKAKKQTTEDVIAKTLSAQNTIKILEMRNRQLQDMIDSANAPDRPYAYGKSTEWMVFGRTRQQYEELQKIARHLSNTVKNPIEALEKIEKYPIKIRDKFILILELSLTTETTK